MAKLGTFSVGSGNVVLTQGRGRNKAVVLDVSFKELEVWAAKNQIDEKKTWDKAWNRAMSTLRSRLQKVVKGAGGYEGVPKFKDFEAFTKELRAISNRTSPMGGILSDPHLIKWEKIGKTSYIGWLDRLADWAVKFQDGEPGFNSEWYFTTPEGRHLMHEKGIKNVPHEYVRNPRRVLPEPFGTHVDKYLPEWAQGVFYKDLAKQMAKKRLSYNGGKLW